jgi:hypothetical protein
MPKAIHIPPFVLFAGYRRIYDCAAVFTFASILFHDIACHLRGNDCVKIVSYERREWFYSELQHILNTS